MSAQITWAIQYLQCKPQVGNYTDVVINVFWYCSGQQQDGESVMTKSVSNVCSLPIPEASFTPYDQLTQDQILDWIWSNGVDKEKIEEQVITEINQAIIPQIVNLPLPWDNK